MEGSTFLLASHSPLRTRSVLSLVALFLSPCPSAAGFPQVCEGLKSYFDRALPVFLLYRYERHQLEAFITERHGTEDNRPLSQVRRAALSIGYEGMLGSAVSCFLLSFASDRYQH